MPPLLISSSGLTAVSAGFMHSEKGFRGFSVKNEKLFLVNPTSLEFFVYLSCTVVVIGVV